MPAFLVYNPRASDELFLCGCHHPHRNQIAHAVETWLYVLRSLSVRFHILQRYLYAYKQVGNAAQIELRAIWDAVEQELGAKKCKYGY